MVVELSEVVAVEPGRGRGGGGGELIILFRRSSSSSSSSPSPVSWFIGADEDILALDVLVLLLVALSSLEGAGALDAED